MKKIFLTTALLILALGMAAEARVYKSGAVGGIFFSVSFPENENTVGAVPEIVNETLATSKNTVCLIGESADKEKKEREEWEKKMKELEEREKELEKKWKEIDEKYK